MKTEVLLALVGASSAIKLGDAPPYFNEPTWRQTWPSASGLVQIDEEIEAAPATPCQENSQPGVTCAPAAPQGQSFFANGMSGHEDLGKDIHMKNVPYHYVQESAEFANGMSGHEDLQQDISMKNIGYHYGQVHRNKDKEEIEFEPKPCACGSSLCENCKAAAALAQKKDGYVDNMGYTKYVHPYFPGTTTPNFRIQQNKQCLEWDRDGNTGNDQHRLRFAACNNTNHQQWFNFHQMSRTIRAYSRQNFIITNVEGQHWNGASYDAILRPWQKDNYNVIDFDASAKCTIMNLDGPNGYALTNNNGSLQWAPCTGAANQKYSISPFEPGQGSYPSK